MRKTKIICSIGPASCSLEVLRQMMESGMDVARFDLGKLSYSFCTDALEKIRRLERELGRTVGILFENKGCEFRVGTIGNGKIFLKKDSEVQLFDSSIVGTDNRISITYPNLLKDVKVGMVILFHYGRVKVKVTGKKEDFLLATVEEEGFVFSHETVHIPKLDYAMDYLSQRDKDDILFAVKEQVDFLALSFVRNANDVLDVTDLLIEYGDDHIQLITKIENSLCLDDFDHILELSDGIMIARGDLGMELPIELLPGIQKRILSTVHLANKIGIVSTEMLASMEEEMRPTRAEVSDVYNAVVDLVDAVSLGRETSVGTYPVVSISTMDKIITQAELELDYEQILKTLDAKEQDDITSSIAHAVVDTANRLNAKAIVTATTTGYTAKKVSKYRPSCPIIATSPDDATVRSLLLHYGVWPVLANQYETTDEIIASCGTIVKERISLKKKDRYLITGGFPADTVNTNFMRVEEI